MAFGLSQRVAFIATLIGLLGTTGLAVALQPASTPTPAPSPAPSPTPAATVPKTGDAKPPAGGQNGPGGPGVEGRPQRGPGGGQNAPNLEASMKLMGRSLKALKASVGDASKKEENLRLVGDMQRGAANAKGLPLPEKLLSAAKTDADKAALTLKSRTELMGLMRKQLDLEQAILDGKTDVATKLVAELAQARENGHEAIGVKED